MTKTSKMTAADHRLIKAVREAIAVANGTAKPGTYRIHTPEEIEARSVRVRMGLTQAEFAKRFGLDLATLRDWEQGRKTPTGAASTLLRVIAKEPKAVMRALQSDA